MTHAWLFAFLASLPLAWTGVDAGQPEGSEAVPAEAPEAARPDPERTLPANVLEVIDGDSLLLLVAGEIRRFEVLGADAPEWVERAATPSVESVEAKRFLTRMLHGERVRVFEPEPGVTDAVGRRRAYVFREPDGLFVDLEIVRQGYGRVSTRADAPYERVLSWYEERARELQRGVWGRPEEPIATTVDPASTTPPDAAQPAAQPQPLLQPDQPDPEPAPSDWVWVTRSGSKYHRQECQHVGATGTRVSRRDAEKTHEPCRTCRPDEG